MIDSLLVDVRMEPGDKRVRLVKLAPAGAKALQNVSQQMREIAESTAGNSKPEVMQRFATMAQRLVNAMSNKV